MAWRGGGLDYRRSRTQKSCLQFPLRFLLASLLVVLLHVVGALPQMLAQQAVVERVDFEGSRRIRSETLKARIFTREGDAYNEETLRRDFQALWNTKYFEDIRLELEDSPDRPNAKESRVKPFKNVL